MATTVGNTSTPAAETMLERGFADVALPIEMETPQTFPSSSPGQTTQTILATTPTVTTDSPEQDRTIAIVLVVIILTVIIVFTLAYVLYQKRRRICRTNRRDKAKPDLSANEVLITPVKANGGAESSPAGLVSGPREARTRQSVPRKWYDSAALKYMDQSTDTLNRV